MTINGFRVSSDEKGMIMAFTGPAGPPDDDAGVPQQAGPGVPGAQQPPVAPPTYGQQPACYGQPPVYGQQPPPYQAAYPVAHAAPTGVMTASDERTWGTLAHVAPFVGGIVGLPFLGALVVFLMYKDRSAFVRRHALESLNFQLTLLIGYVISAVLMFVLIGFATAAALAVASIVLQILGAVAASRGEDYRYPLTIRFVS